ncbi:MAG: sulfur carrier protein ThiS [Spirochaetaceae bacterium]|jgi:sulfur carrier protein|nr:sulfur carrier protein ThiS [Spirochaetaceae bacterium]
MRITVNGKPENVSGKISISKLLEELKTQDALYVTVQLNGVILKREDFDTVTVNEDDVIEMLYFMGGGLCKTGKISRV